MANKFVVNVDTFNRDRELSEVERGITKAQTIWDEVNKQNLNVLITDFQDVIITFARAKNKDNSLIIPIRQLKEILRGKLEKNYLKLGVELDDELIDKHFNRYKGIYFEILTLIGSFNDNKELIIFNKQTSTFELANSYKKTIEAKYSFYSEDAKGYKTLQNAADVMNDTLKAFGLNPADMDRLFIYKNGALQPNTMLLK